MVGLGDAKKYLKDENQHVPLKHTNNYSNIENNFSSVNTHYGTTLSRRDDIESFAYILLYFESKGKLIKRLKSEDSEKKYAWKM